MQIATILTSVAYLATTASAVWTTDFGWPLPKNGVCNGYVYCGRGGQAGPFKINRGNECSTVTNSEGRRIESATVPCTPDNQGANPITGLVYCCWS
ncbi:hypothetical protein HYFRA_00004146 [Hymenoscyphus fraxineus]|uniref:Uncharacterized protein n=1 Tax=Hymenoscyphus fraxineus TaxID=746836 RepID=A0A9N9PKF3_9HELO|nr:hypothetical protein HYFRA_00004146 [Hymenoscyphus fraxineus]